MPRIVYLATADARGHLMRAQLLVHALRQGGANVDVVTTSHAGCAFLRGFGIDARILSHDYAMQFDTRQNMLRPASNRNVAGYMANPTKMLRDIWRLQRALRASDLLVNDSFHPAAIVMGVLPAWRRKVVHVYGGSLREAVLSNFDGIGPGFFAPLFRRCVGWQIDAARARFEHDFAYALGEASDQRDHRLPTPVAIAGPQPRTGPREAVVYLNPHFRDTALADALCAGIAEVGLSAHRVGEGYAASRGWLSVDPDWATRAAHADVIVSAPGMAALSVAMVYGRPIVLVITDQPEQASNAKRAVQLRIPHRTVTWRGDALDFQRQVAAAVAVLAAGAPASATLASGSAQARARVDAWTDRLLALCAAPA